MVSGYDCIQLDFGEHWMLPTITTDLEQASRDLAHHGLALLGDALSPQELEAARRRLDAQARAERNEGIAFLERGDVSNGRYETGQDLPNQRVWSLINKGQIFRDIAVKQDLLAIVERAFARSYGYPDDVLEQFGFDQVLISSLGANIARKGGVPMPLHADQGFAPGTTSYPLLVNVLWMLSDFREDNGATRVAPGSHAVDQSGFYENPPTTVPVQARAGTAMIFDGRLWHGTGQNVTNEPRYALFTTFCRPFVRQIENYALSLTSSAYEACSDQLLALLGFRTWSVLGSVEGSSHGDLVNRNKTGAAEME